MKKFIIKVIVAALVVLNILPSVCFAQTPEITSKNAILMDMSNSMVMYEKGGSEKIQPAGFTKIVTALVVLENCEDLSTVISSPRETIEKCDFSFGNMGVLSDEELSVDNLLHGMLLYDAAEAAEILAGFTFGSYPKFISAMNDIAEKAGATDTVFKNAGGYYHEEQVSTLEDIGRIAIYAMKNAKFAEIVAKDTVEIAPTNKYHETRHLANTNMFVGRVRSLDFYSKRVYGVKTSQMSGYGNGVCIAFENSRGNFICVTNGAENATAAHRDAQILREYSVDGFENVKVANKGDLIEEVPVPNGRTDHVLLKTADDLYVQLPVGYDESKIFKMTSKEVKISAPIEKDEVLGKLSVSYDGNEIGGVDLIAYSAVEHSAGKSVRLFFINIFTSPFFYIPVIAVVGIFLYLLTKEIRNAKGSKR